MTVVYAETSAVLAWVFGEDVSGRLAAALNAADRVAASVLTPLEAVRGVVRARREGRIAAPDASRLEGLLERIAPQWELMEITTEVRTRAARSFPVEPVRTLDAIHLATALEFAKIYPEISILSLDARILANLEPLGLANAAT